MIIKNLDSWGDEIILLLRLINLNKPDYELIEISDLNIRTPLIYGGGIKNVNESSINLIDRVVVNPIYQNFLKKISKLSAKSLVKLNLNIFKSFIFTII